MSNSLTLWVIGVSEVEEGEEMFKQIMAENFQSWWKTFTTDPRSSANTKQKKYLCTPQSTVENQSLKAIGVDVCVILH